MSEFFLELFSEEMPANLQSAARENLLNNFQNFFDKKNIIYNKDVKTFSTPNRLVICFKNISNEIIQKAEEIRGPNINAPEKAVDGFIKSNKIEKKNIYKKKTDKGEFYFYRKQTIKINVKDILISQIPIILGRIPWKKSMKWGDHSLYWGRPLKSIMAIFNGKTLNFKFYHIESSNFTYIDKNFEEKIKKFKTFDKYLSFFKNLKIIIDNEKRKDLIELELLKLSKKKI